MGAKPFCTPAFQKASPPTFLKAARMGSEPKEACIVEVRSESTGNPLKTGGTNLFSCELPWVTVHGCLVHPKAWAVIH